MRGKGRAGSSPSGREHRLDLALEVLLEPGWPARRSTRRAPAAAPLRRPASAAAARSGSGTGRRRAACARSWMAVSCSGMVMLSAASCPPPSSCSCFSPATRISKNSSRLLHEMHRNLQPLEQRHRLVEGLVQHPLVELEERQFPVDVVLRCLEVRRVHRPSAVTAAPWAALGPARIPVPDDGTVKPGAAPRGSRPDGPQRATSIGPCGTSRVARRGAVRARKSSR